MKIYVGVLQSEANLPILPLLSPVYIEGNFGILPQTSCLFPERARSLAIIFLPILDLFFVVIAYTKSGDWYGHIRWLHWNTPSWSTQQEKTFTELSGVLLRAIAFSLLHDIRNLFRKQASWSLV